MHFKAVFVGDPAEYATVNRRFIARKSYFDADAELALSLLGCLI